MLSSMRFAVCNEMFKDWPHEDTASAIAGFGYQGVELAPFTLGPDPASLPSDERRRLRGVFESAGLKIVGLHWLLAGTTGLSITSPDPAVLGRTGEHLNRLAGLCRDLGGEVMVFGSPNQRSVGPGGDRAAAREHAIGLFREIAPRAAGEGVVICFEPLAPNDTDFINTMAEGVVLVESVGHKAFQLHLDVKAMCGAETKPPADVIREEGGRHLRHFHANDPNLLGPGMGDFDFAPVAAALLEVGYDRWVSVETFVDGPGPEEIARQSIMTLKRTIGGDHAR
jgi:sugar phosphate isomerase/epimerase